MTYVYLIIIDIYIMIKHIYSLPLPERATSISSGNMHAFNVEKEKHNLVNMHLLTLAGITKLAETGTSAQRAFFNDNSILSLNVYCLLFSIAMMILVNSNRSQYYLARIEYD